MVVNRVLSYNVYRLRPITHRSFSPRVYDFAVTGTFWQKTRINATTKA